MKLHTLLLSLTACCLLVHPTHAAKKNVLFIGVDDLRNELGCYGAKHMKTPHINQLAKDGMLFERAYCQQAICGPSRISVLTGYRPDSTKIYSLDQSLNKTLTDVMSMPRLFKENGYRTVSLGKIYHHHDDDKTYWDVLDSCSKPFYASAENKALEAKKMEAAKAKKLKGKELRIATKGPAYESADVPDNAYGDGMATDLAIKALRSKDDRPLFLAVGFKKPHLPFVAPKKYWDMYDAADIKLPSRKMPTDAPEVAFTTWGELCAYDGMPAIGEGDCTDEQTRSLIHGYRACVSYIDTQIGRLLAELDKQGMREDTITVLWSDHGWKLGDYGDWCKHTNFELDARVPLIFSGSGIPRDKRSRALVENVDIFPTLANWAGLPVPEHCEGASLLPLFAKPDRAWKTAAFSQYPRRGGMGYTIRSGQWRYTEWRRKDGTISDRELYNHAKSQIATANLVNNPEYASTLKRMAKILKAGPEAARPE